MLREFRSLMQMLDNLDEEEGPQPQRRAPRPHRLSGPPAQPAAVEIPQSVAAIAPLVARPTTFIFDSNTSQAGALAAILGSTGAQAEIFTETSQFVRGLLTTPPSLVFLDVTGQGEQAIDALFAMGERNYSGGVQLMGAESSPVIEVVRRMGERHSLQMLPALRKPLETRDVRNVLISQNFTIAPPPATSLGEALSEDWVEFWYQPKIDLQRRAIAGVEVFARVHHPERGMLHPVVFLEDASERDLVQLSEKALSAALQAARDFSEVGIHLRVAVNIPVQALFALPVIQMVRDLGPHTDRWPGLLLDITAPQLTAEFPRVEAIGPSLVACNTRIAIDDFGRSRLPLPSLRQLPIAELKLDRTLVQGVAGDPNRMTCCESVIGLAHHLGAVAVAVGIEQAEDMKAMAALQCDVGQGFLFGQPMPRDQLASILMRRAVKEERPAGDPEPSAAPAASLRAVAAQAAKPAAQPVSLHSLAASTVPSLRDIAAVAAPKKRHR